MASTTEINYTAAPGFGPIYRGVLLGRKKGFREGQAWPQMRSTWNGARADLAKVAAYRGVTGAPSDGKLPLLYLHVLTSPLHLGMMAHPDFPLSPLGGVHARNFVVQHRPIGEAETLDLACALDAARVVKQGLDFDITTQATVNGEVVWEGRSSYLFRGKFGAASGFEAPRHEDLGTVTKTAQWRVPKDMGRRYAKISGDYNPIHISGILAKLFGFKRDLIHGMWSAARALSETEGTVGAGPTRFEVIFKGPIWIGAGTDMKLAKTDAGQRFDLFCSGNDRPCITALLRDAVAGEAL